MLEKLLAPAAASILTEGLHALHRLPLLGQCTAAALAPPLALAPPAEGEECREVARRVEDDALGALAVTPRTAALLGDVGRCGEM